MASPDDHALLHEFADQQSESAFAELVQRHLNLVYSVAMRYAGNPSDAQDIAQAVFLILAKKAGSLRQRTTLTGWLYETTRLTASQLCRTRLRRQIRDQEVYMQSTLNPSGSDDVWRQISPYLEEAMSRLNKQDRMLLALRFYENKTGTEAAQLMGIGADATHKRTARALEKLRKFFEKCGVTSTTAAISETIAANSIQAAPAGLSATISNAALSGTNTAITFAAAKTMTLFQKTFAMAAVATAVGVTVFALHLQKQNRALQQQQTAFTAQFQQLQQQLNGASNGIASLTDENASLKANADELLRLRAEVTQLHRGNHPPIATLLQPHDPQLQIFIQSGFYYVPDSDLQSMGIQWTADSQGGQIGYLDASQLKDIREALNGASDVVTLSLPRIVTINGERADFTVSRQFFLLNPNYIKTNLDYHPGDTDTNVGAYTNLGEFLSAQPFYSTNSSTFDLNYNFELKDLMGDPSQPTVQTTQMTNDVTFATGKTLILEQPLSPGSWMPNLPGMTNTPAGPQDLLILVTPKVIDSKQVATSQQQ